MLNEKNLRELVYVVHVDEIKPIEGRDRVECAVVNGWTVMVKKDQFKVGDPGIYFEIDSQVPEKEPFEFLAPKHYKIKTQKYKTPNGQFWSQGLLMHAEDFGWTIETTGQFAGDVSYIIDDEGKEHWADNESRFLTEKLNVIYAEPGDNKRKASSVDKYKKMVQQNGKLFSHQPFRWLMKRDWGKKLLFVFFGHKKNNRNWPAWVKKTDEERVENMPWILKNKDPWFATEKIDGTSTTFTMKKRFLKNDFYVCSRNVVFDKPNKQCYYDTNVYLEMAEKYHIEDVLNDILKNNPHLDWVTIQGETYGAGVQKRDYSIKDHDFMAFNLIFSDRGRVNTGLMTAILYLKYQIPCVPILDGNYILPDTVEELREYVDSEPSVLDKKIKEGIVFRSQDGSQSFKCVSPNYLIKYHQ